MCLHATSHDRSQSATIFYMNGNSTNQNMVRLTEPTNGRTTDRLHTFEMPTHSSSNAGITDAMLISWQPIIISFLLPLLYIYVYRVAT